MSKEYEVVKADHKEDWSGQYGPMTTFSLELREAGDGTGNTFQVEMNQKPTTAPPQAGETLTGTITPNKNPDFPPRFKKEFKEGGSGGSGSGGGRTFKPRDPSEIAGARHAHNLLVAAHSFPRMELGSENPTLHSKIVQERLEDLEAFACVLDEKTAAISAAAVGGAVAAEEKAKTDSDVPF